MSSPEKTTKRGEKRRKERQIKTTKVGPSTSTTKSTTSNEPSPPEKLLPSTNAAA